MKLLFLQKDIFAKPAIMTLSAVLKKNGHQCDVLIEDMEKDFLGKTLEINPDIIAFSITTGEHPWMNEIGACLSRMYTKPIICGGVHPTFYPDVINEDYLDAICMGEGDEAIIEFVNAIENDTDTTQIENFVVKKDGKIFRNDLRPLIEDLDSLPFYDRKIYERYKIFRISNSAVLFHKGIKTNRGCPYHCTFCFNQSYNDLYRGKGKVVRHRSISNIMEELRELTQHKKLDYISFEDDSFMLASRKWISDFLDRYKAEINLPFKICSQANLIDDEMMAKLKDSNCYSMRVGIEAGNEEYRNNIFRKGISDSDILNIARLAKKYGIKLQTFNIMGSPGESLDMCLETYELNRRIRPDFVWCSLLNPYPGTGIHAYALENGFLEDCPDGTSIGYSYFLDSPIKMEHRRKIHNLQKLVYLAILLRLPRPVLTMLIKLPLSKIYSLIFGGTFFIGLYRIDKTGLRELLRLSLTSFIRYI